MDYSWQFGFVWKYRDVLLGGIMGTIEITLWTTFFSTVFALIVSLMNLSRVKLLRYSAVAYIEIFRAIPTLVGLVWVYYSLPILTSFSLKGSLSAIAGLTICRACYIAEVFRAGIESVEQGQMEAARGIGMSYFMAMRRIILPQAVRRMIPPFMNQFATIIKYTSMASVLSVIEILHEANDVIQQTFRPMEVYTFVAILYFIIIFPIAQFSRYLERRQISRQLDST
jgi:polar amino acid transport system permease protein